MLVLHAHWHPPADPHASGHVLFWAEDGAAGVPSRDRRLKRAQPHPFAAAPGQLRELLGQWVDVAEAATGKVTLLLPTDRHGPLRSPSLLHEWELETESDGEPALLPWTVTGLRLAPTTAFDVLGVLPAQDRLPGGDRAGDDVRYWQHAAALVQETLAAQRVQPALVEVQPRKAYVARWQPVLDAPEDATRRRRLVEAMPPLCRAATDDPRDSPDSAPHPRALLDAFLDATTDALAREAARGSLTAPGNPTVARKWLDALATDDPTVYAPGEPLHHLYGSYRRWLRNLHVAGDATFRIAFRLEAPEQQQGPEARDWTLHFLLQARDDPSLMLPAERVWQHGGDVLDALDRTFHRPQEKLLAGLGYAARLFEPLRRGLQAARPDAVALATDEAYTFLRECVPLLEQSGFGILVPPWWTRPDRRLGVRVRVQSSGSTTSSGTFTLDSVLQYDWTLALGDTALSREEFDALVQLKEPLVQLRGQWVRLDTEQVEAAIAFWERRREHEALTFQEVLQMGLAEQAELDGLPVEDVAFEGELGDWMEHLRGEARLTELPEPEGLEATLRPYQRYGFAWLDFMHRSGLGAILADDMGLGKTVQALTLLQHDREEDRYPGPVLLVCPTSVVTNWAREARRFTPELRVVEHHGPDRRSGEAFARQARAHDLVLTSYALARRDADDLREVDWYGLVLDEAQAIKNPDTKQARMIRSLPAGFRLALTGTPIENRLSELWSIMHFLNPGFLGPRKQFQQTFARPIERHHDDEAARQLRALTQPFILRRVKTDPTVIQDLPEKQETKVYCHLTEEQATLYEAVVRDTMAEIQASEGIGRKGLVLSMLMKLKQVCNHPVQFLHEREGYRPEEDHGRSGKLERFSELIETIHDEGDRALLFTQFTEMGGLLRRYVQERLGLPTLFLHGGTPGHRRDELVQQFQQDAEAPPLFILSLKAGGTGLNLTRANHVFHFDRWWNPAVEDQATDRAFRIGQKRNVLVHKFVCVGTLEERIDEMIEAKKNLADRIVGQGEDWLTEMSTDDLRDLVALRHETIAEEG